MSLFKANYGYILRTSLIQKRMDKFMRLYLDLFKSLKFKKNV